VWSTEVNLARRPTCYIPTPANANFALGSDDAVRGQLQCSILRPGGQGVEIPMAVKTREKWNTDGIL